MTAMIVRIDALEAYDLLFPNDTSTLSTIELETLHRAMMNSAKLWAGMDDARILAVWGLIAPTLMSDLAYLWLYTTEHLRGHTFMFIRHSQRAVQEMLEEYPLIVGHASVDAPRSQQWLRWLGAEFGDPIDHKFIPFTIRAKQWQQDSAQSA